MRSPRLTPVVAAVTVFVLTVSMGAAHGSRFHPGRARGKMIHFVNHYRRHHGVGSLRMDRDIVRVAQRHSRRMAASRTLFHSSDMWTKLRGQHASCWGENVGMGPAAWRVFKGWVRSAGHRANMLNRHYRRTGIGVVRAHGALWITMIYYG